MVGTEASTQAFVPAARHADVAVIVVNYNTAFLLERCLGRLRDAIDGLAVQVVIVDNASRDGSAEFIASRFPDCTLIANPVNVGFGRANNQALDVCNARHVLLLNADAFVLPGTLRRSIDHLDNTPRCGVLGARLVDEAGHGLFSGRSFPTPWQAFLLRTGLFKRWTRRSDEAAAIEGAAGARECDWVVGCYYVVRRSVIDAIGLFDPRYFLYFEEVDHCRRVWQGGWTVECLTDAAVIHVGGASAESEGALGVGRQLTALQTESGLLYFRKHGGWTGVLAEALLGLATQGLLLVKSILRHRDRAAATACLAQAWTICRLMLLTRAGTRPTR